MPGAGGLERRTSPERRYAAARAPGEPRTRRGRPARARPRRRGSPDPIPNSAAKPAIAQSTADPVRGRTGRRARAGRVRPHRGQGAQGRGRRAPSALPGGLAAPFPFYAGPQGAAPERVLQHAAPCEMSIPEETIKPRSTHDSLARVNLGFCMCGDKRMWCALARSRPNLYVRLGGL